MQYILSFQSPCRFDIVAASHPRKSGGLRV
jgi:hypothetical protein